MKAAGTGEAPERPSAWMQSFLTEQAWNRALRRFWFSVLASPAIAGLWVHTAALARLFEAGEFHPTQGGALYDVAWIALHYHLGMAGLHATFGLIVAGTVALGIRSFLQARSIERGPGFARVREVSRERVTRLEREALADPVFRERIEAARREGPGGRRLVARVVGAAVRIAPHASALLTAILVYLALRS